MRKHKAPNHLSNQDISGVSFRDPAGFVFINSKGKLLRQINKNGLDDYNCLISSSLYDELVSQKLLIEHNKASIKDAFSDDAKLVIAPSPIPFISYPFEWSFDQLKDAALLTLKIQKLALGKGITLKDASAYNVQFIGSKPIFIDTLSFEKYKDGAPWQAYGQFCRHFLSPLTLMSKKDLRLLQLLRANIDGVPLDLTAKILPKSSKLKPGQFMHIFAHSKSQQNNADIYKPSTRKLSKRNQLAIIDSLERTIMSLKFPKSKTEWGEYYTNTNYIDSATKNKKLAVLSYSKKINPKTVVDLGGNDGTYSRMFSEQGIATVCADIDPVAVQKNYLSCKNSKDDYLMPLLIDLTNPGGSLGWANQERDIIAKRLKCDLVIALALIHHLAISNNLPFSLIAEYLSKFAPSLIIEFVPKSDSQVKKLLATRKDIFDQYNQESFERVFGQYYKLVGKKLIVGSKRTLYLFSE